MNNKAFMQCALWHNAEPSLGMVGYTIA